MAALNLCAKYSTRPEVIDIHGRVSSAGALVAPANGGAGFTPGGSAGVYTITFTQPYAEYLGCAVTIESATTPASLATTLQYVASFNATTNVLTIRIFTLAATPADTASAFSFTATFADSVVP